MGSNQASVSHGKPREKITPKWSRWEKEKTLNYGSPGNIIISAIRGNITYKKLKKKCRKLFSLIKVSLDVWY